MAKEKNIPLEIGSISGFHRAMSLNPPRHPLISLIDFGDFDPPKAENGRDLILDFYTIAIKKDFKGKFKYGQNHYDFDEGVMSFIAPGQLLSESAADNGPISGKLLVFHRDFLRGYPIAQRIKELGFFSYSLNEALYLSEGEETMIMETMEKIGAEYRSPIDGYSQDVMVSHLDLLLNYSNRFYNRQFLTRKHVNNGLLVRLENLLTDHFNGDAPREKGLPSVGFVSEALKVSPGYLNDMLKSLTGTTAQQHIRNKLMERAKELLGTTSLTVAEVAYLLGFEHPQSFNRLFKKKTDVSPLQFRSSLLGK